MLTAEPARPLHRSELALTLWALVRDRAGRLPDLKTYLEPGGDVDDDGVHDRDDPLPFLK